LLNRAAADRALGTSRALSMYRLPFSHDISDTNEHAWQAADVALLGLRR
jgi:hypothetical protein